MASQINSYSNNITQLGYESDESSEEAVILSRKERNKFVFESFAEKLSKVKIRLPNNPENDVTFMDLGAAELKLEDTNSNLMMVVKREKVVNQGSDLAETLTKILPYTDSFVGIVKNSLIIYNLLLSDLKENFLILLTDLKKAGKLVEKNLVHSKNFDLDKILTEEISKFNPKFKTIHSTETKTNFPQIASILELITSLIKDVRDSVDKINKSLIEEVFPILVNLIGVLDKAEEVDKSFNIVVNLIKFLTKVVSDKAYFIDFYKSVSNLVFHRTAYTRKFASEALTFCLKNVEWTHTHITIILDSTFKVISEQPSNEDSSSTLKSVTLHSDSRYVYSEMRGDSVSNLFVQLLLGNTNSKISPFADKNIDNILESLIGQNLEFHLLGALALILTQTFVKLHNLTCLPTSKAKQHLKGRAEQSSSAFDLMVFALIKLVNSRIEKVCEMDESIVLDYLNLFEEHTVAYNHLASKDLKYKVGLLAKLFQLKLHPRLATVSFFTKLIETAELSFYLFVKECLITKGGISSQILSEVFAMPHSTSIYYLEALNEIKIDVLALICVKHYDLIDTATFFLEDTLFGTEYSALVQSINFTTKLLMLCFDSSYLSQLKLSSFFHYIKHEATNNDSLADQSMQNQGCLNSLKLSMIFQNLISKVLEFEHDKANKIHFLAYICSAYKYIHYRMNGETGLVKLNFGVAGLLKLLDEDKSLFGSITKILVSLDLIDISGESTLDISERTKVLIKAEFSNSISELESEALFQPEADYSSMFHKYYYQIHLNRKVYLLNSELLLRSLHRLTQLQGSISILEDDQIIEIIKNNIKKPTTLKFLADLTTENLNLLISKHFNMKSLKFLETILFPLLSSPEIALRESACKLCEPMLAEALPKNWQFENKFHELVNYLKSTFTLKKGLLNTKEYILVFDRVTVLLEDSLNFKVGGANNVVHFLLIYKFIFHFMFGCYWINLTKEVWPALTKAIGKLLGLIQSTCVISNEEVIGTELNYYISHFKMFSFAVKHVGASDEFLKKYSHITEKSYSKFAEIDQDALASSNNHVDGISLASPNLLNSLRTKDHLTLMSHLTQELISANLISNERGKQSEDKLINLSNRLMIFYSGVAQSISTISSLFSLNKSTLNCNLLTTMSINYYNSELQTLRSESSSVFFQSLGSLELKCQDTSASIFMTNLFFNYCLEKATNIIPSKAINKIKIIESVLSLFNSIDFHSLEQIQNQTVSLNIATLSEILDRLVIESKSLEIQKICISIQSNLNPFLRLNKELLLSASSNPQVIEPLYNFDKLKNSKNNDLVGEERFEVIKFLTRIYYSKYFGLWDSDRKKHKTKSKGSLVTFFIQLNDNEMKHFFELLIKEVNEATSIISSCTMDGLCKSMENADEQLSNLRFIHLIKSRKFIEILTVNFKQLSNKFEPYSKTIIMILTQTLVFIKKASVCFSENESDDIIDTNAKHPETSEIVVDVEDEHKETKVGILIAELQTELEKFKLTKHKEISQICNPVLIESYSKHYLRMCKEIRKASLELLSLLFNSFNYQLEEKQFIRQSIQMIYPTFSDSIIAIQSSSHPQENAFFNFIFKLSKTISLQFIFQHFPEIVNGLLKISENINIDYQMISKLIDFLDNILSPKHRYLEHVEGLFLLGNHQSKYATWLELGDKSNPTNFRDRINLNTLSSYYNEEVQNLKLNYFYFEGFNRFLIQLVSSQKILPFIKSPLTQQYLEVLVKLWTLVQPTTLSMLHIESENFSPNCAFGEELIKNKQDENSQTHFNLYFKLASAISDDDMHILFNFIFQLLSDRKILKPDFEGLLFTLLKNIHYMFLLLKQRNSDSWRQTEIAYFDTFLDMLYQIEEPNSRLVLVLIINEFSCVSQNIKEYLLVLNRKTKQTTLQSSSMNVDSEGLEVSVLEALNLISEYSSQSTNNFEPLIYQLLYFLNSEDYSLQSLSFRKLKALIRQLIKGVTDSSQAESAYLCSRLERIVKVIYNLINYCKSSSPSVLNYLLNIISDLMEGFESIQYLNDTTFRLSKLLTYDLMIKTGENDIKAVVSTEKIELNLIENNEEVTQEEIIGNKGDSVRIMDGLMHIKLATRLETFKSVYELLNNGAIKGSSITTILLPIIKFVLSPDSYTTSDSSTKRQPSDFNVFTETKDVEALQALSIQILSALPSILNLSEIQEILVYFQKKIVKTKSKGDDHVKILNRSLSSILETTPNHQSFNFKSLFAETANEILISNYAKYNLVSISTENKDDPKGMLQDPASVYVRLEEIKHEDSKLVFSTIRKMNELTRAKSNMSSSKENDRLIMLIKNEIFPLLRESTIIESKKGKSHSYYLDNSILKGYLIVIQRLDLFKFQQEFLKLIFDVITNLKSREHHVREKAREAISITITVLGEYVIPIFVNELKFQLKSGYQKFLLSHSICGIISQLNKLKAGDEEFSNYIIFDAILINTSDVLLNDLFGEISEDKEAIIAAKYPESKSNKSIESFGILLQNIRQENSLCLTIYSLWNYVGRLEINLDNAAKLTSLFNKLANSVKLNKNLNFQDLYLFMFGLSAMNYDVNLEKQKAIKKGDNLIIKGSSSLDIEDYVPPTLQDQVNARFLLQQGVNNYGRDTDDILSSKQREKNAELLKNEISCFGMELLIHILKKHSIESMSEITHLIEEIIKVAVFYIKHEKNERLLTKAFKLILFFIQLSSEEKIPVENVDDFELMHDQEFDALEASYSMVQARAIQSLVKPHSKLILGVLLRNLASSQAVEFTQIILKVISELMNKKLNFAELNDNQLASILDFTKLRIGDSNIRIHIYSCLYHIIKNKVLHSNIFGIILFVLENYIEASENSVLNICQQIIIEFFTNYIYSVSEYVESTEHYQNKAQPKNKKQLSKSIVESWQEKCINMLIVNAEGDNARYILNSLRLLRKLISNSSTQVATSLVELVFLKFISLFVSDKLNKESRSELEGIYTSLLGSSLIEESRLLYLIQNLKSQLSTKITSFNHDQSNTNKLALRAYLDFFGIVFKVIAEHSSSFEGSIVNALTVESSINGESGKLKKKSTHISSILSDLIYSENYRTEKCIHNFVEASEGNAGGTGQLIKLHIPHWDILYLCLLVFDTLITISKEKGRETLICLEEERYVYQFFKTLEHPNLNVKTISVRVISNLLSKIFAAPKEVNKKRETTKPKSKSAVVFKFLHDFNLTFREKSLTEYVLSNITLILMQPSISDITIISCKDVILSLSLSFKEFGKESCNEKVQINIKDGFEDFLRECLSECRAYINKSNQHANTVTKRILEILKDLASVIVENLHLLLTEVIGFLSKNLENKVLSQETKEFITIFLADISNMIGDSAFNKELSNAKKADLLLKKKRKAEHSY